MISALRFFIKKGTRHNCLLLLRYFVMLSAHPCKALVISCIDYRFVTKVRDFILNRGLDGSYDLITVPGASLNLETIMDNIDTSIRLHNPSEIYIFDHEDCGAYGKNDSEKAHFGNLKKAKIMLLEKYSDKFIQTYISYFGEVKELL